MIMAGIKVERISWQLPFIVEVPRIRAAASSLGAADEQRDSPSNNLCAHATSRTGSLSGNGLIHAFLAEY